VVRDVFGVDSTDASRQNKNLKLLRRLRLSEQTHTVQGTIVRPAHVKA